tara:strand:+ start:97 stop:261 length:165 start_codon:yes stop_codon:yes gene_type:complete
MNKFKFAQDAVFFITVGFVWVVLILSIALFFLPYYLLREVWNCYETWQINKEKS